jgi:hypothetical protein
MRLYNHDKDDSHIIDHWFCPILVSQNYHHFGHDRIVSHRRMNMSLPGEIESVVEAWYEEFLGEGYSSNKAADKAQEKFENNGDLLLTKPKLCFKIK